MPTEAKRIIILDHRNGTVTVIPAPVEEAHDQLEHAVRAWCEQTNLDFHDDCEWMAWNGCVQIKERFQTVQVIL